MQFLSTNKGLFHRMLNFQVCVENKTIIQGHGYKPVTWENCLTLFCDLHTDSVTVPTLTSTNGIMTYYDLA